MDLLIQNDLTIINLLNFFIIIHIDLSLLNSYSLDHLPSIYPFASQVYLPTPCVVYS